MTTIDTTITHGQPLFAPRRFTVGRCVATALAIIGAVAAAAHATDLGLDTSRFFVQHQVKGETAPIYQVLPATAGPSPFNDKVTPYLLPCGVQNFGGQLQVDSVAGGAVAYPRLTVRLYRTDGTLIVTKGFNGNVSLDHLDSDLAAMAPGTSEDVGYVPVSSVNPWKGWLFQPKDLPQNKPVRMELSVTPFDDAQFTKPGADANPGNDVLNLWVERTCP